MLVRHTDVHLCTQRCHLHMLDTQYSLSLMAALKYCPILCHMPCSKPCFHSAMALLFSMCQRTINILIKVTRLFLHIIYVLSVSRSMCFVFFCINSPFFPPSSPPCISLLSWFSTSFSGYSWLFFQGRGSQPVWFLPLWAWTTLL